MKKRWNKIFLSFIISFFISVNTSFAVTLTTEELGEEVLRVNPSASYFYVVGEYVFTSSHDKLTIEDLMLAARSIEVSDDSGLTNQDPIYGNMATYQYNAKISKGQIVGYEYVENFTGTSTPKDVMNIKYIDYQEAKEIVKYTVTFDNDGTISTSVVKEGKVVTKPEDPTKEGYKFIGWYNGDEVYDFTKPVTGDITLTAKYVPYDMSLIEAEEKTYSVNSGVIQTHEIFKSNETTTDNSLLIKFSELTNTIYIQMKSLVTGEEPYDEVLEMYEIVKDDKSYLYYKTMDEESQEEIWYYTIETTDSSEGSITDYKSIEKVTSDIEGQEKYRFTLDKEDYSEDNKLMTDFESDIVGYAYVVDGYLTKIFIDYRESLNEIDKNECEEYATTVIYSMLNEISDFAIPQEIIDKAIFVE